MKILFWLLAAVMFYCYLGYPIILVLLSKFFSKKVSKSASLPGVSLILSVWNEEDVIEGKVKNLLNLDYPPEKVEILIGSDASTDRTNEILQRLSHPRLKFLINPVRQGKMKTLQTLVQKARNDILVFTDARQIFDSQALRELTANFSDPQVGCVSGELMFSKKDTTASRGVNLYWDYEKFIRRHESQIHSMMGATGAIYAMRRELFVQGPPDTILDDMHFPFMVIRQGYRAVFDDRAKAYDEVAQSPEEEHRRKARTLCGNYQLFLRMPDMFNPFRSPIAWQLFSHKFLRLMMPFVLVGFFLANMTLLGISFYRNLFVLQCLFYVMAMIGIWASRRNQGSLSFVTKVCAIPQMFCLLHFSAVSGLVRFIFSGQNITWQKARENSDSPC